MRLKKETVSLLSIIRSKYSTSDQTEHLMVHIKKYLQVISFQQGKTASLVTSKMCCFLLYSLWVLNRNATSRKSLAGHGIFWFHFHPGYTTLLTNHCLQPHKQRTENNVQGSRLQSLRCQSSHHTALSKCTDHAAGSYFLAAFTWMKVVPKPHHL